MGNPYEVGSGDRIKEEEVQGTYSNRADIIYVCIHPMCTYVCMHYFVEKPNRKEEQLCFLSRE
jgi:hypothetical protein